MAAQSLSEVFAILRLHGYISFINYCFIELLIKHYGTDEDCERLKEYISSFLGFCQRNVFEVPASVFSKTCCLRMTAKVFVLKCTEEILTLAGVESIKRRVAQEFDLEPSTLHLCSVKKGCIELHFMVPHAVAERIFPLSQVQQLTLKQIGVRILTHEEMEVANNTERSDKAHKESSRVNVKQENKVSQISLSGTTTSSSNKDQTESSLLEASTPSSHKYSASGGRKCLALMASPVATSPSRSTKIGHAVIITNDYHYVGTKLSPLTETHKDGIKMAQVFNGLGYDVQHHRNLTQGQMQQLFSQVTASHYPKSYHCIVVVFSGHGTTNQSRGHIISQDCANFPVEEMIDFFMPVRSPTIATIPKVFLIDACLGDRNLHQFAVTVPKGAEGTSEPAMGKGGRPIETIIVPDKGNYLLAHSTSIGDQSYEIKEQGGVWLNALADKIWAKAQTDSVTDILSAVNGELQQKYQQPHFREAMTQPHFTSKLQGVVHFVPKQDQKSLPKQPSAEQMSVPQPLGEITPRDKGIYRAQLNEWKQQKKISEPKYGEPTKTKNGGFLATVSFKLMSTSETLCYPSSDPKGTVKEANEEAARVAIKNVEAKERRVPRSAISRQTSSNRSPGIQRQPSGDSNPLKTLKEGCDSARYQFEWYEIQTHQHEKFQFRVTVTGMNGHVVCVETGAVKGSKRDAKYDTASKANAKLGFFM